MNIYKDYDQAGLDWQYNNRGRVPGFADHLSLWEKKSEEAASSCRIYQDIPYGQGPAETLDIYPGTGTDAKVLVFIHGGYWQAMNKSNFRFIAPAFLSHGFTVVIISYPLAPEVSMRQIVSSCGLAISWVFDHIDGYGGDPESIYLAGHSAGGHLALMMNTVPFARSGASLRGTVALSGLYNLTPIQLSFVNEKIGMDANMAAAFSPVNLEPVPDTRILLATGEAESEEYHSQLEEMHAAWKNKSIIIDKCLWPGLNHFSILTAFTDASSDFHQKTIDWLTSNH
jgi:arylformamidase